MVRLGILIGPKSRGSNMLAIASACAEGRLPAEVAVVVAPSLNAPGALAAQEAGLHVVAVSPGEDEAERMLAALAGVDFVCLAGFLRLVPAGVLRAFPDRVVNIHPALLPEFGGKGMYGMRVHEAVIAAGKTESGPTVHLVNERYDEGRILLQKRVPVLSDDTPETLAARVLEVEHEAYVEALRGLISGV